MTINQYAPTNAVWVDKNGKLTVQAQIWLRELYNMAGGSIGIDHGRLFGLLDDDHPQYLNAVRGDARYDALGAADAAVDAHEAALDPHPGYQPIDADLTAIAALVTTAFGRALLTLSGAADFTAIANIFTDVLKGLTPASGGGTANFLRADATWAPPPFFSPDSYTLSGDESTAADTVAVDLPGLEFTFEPNSTYVFRWVGNVSPAANTTGVGFQLSVA